MLLRHRSCRRGRTGQFRQNVCGGTRRRRCSPYDRSGELLGIRREDQVFDVLRRIRKRHQLGAGGPGRCLNRTDHDRQRPSRQRRTESDEISPLQVAEHLRLPAVHAEKIGGTRHVDVEEGASHQEVGGFRRDVLRKLREALRSNDACQSPLSASAHQVGHGAERHLAGFFRDIATDGGCKHLRLVHHHQHRIPVFAVGIEQPVQEGACRTHLLLDIEPFQRQDAGHPVLTDTSGDADELRFRPVSVHHHVPILIGKRDEITFGIDDDLLHPWCRLFKKTPQKM